ncbi:glycoside hydrolase family 3 C-terminal domain-containing protein [Asticcacaulis sp. AND118]|uniref:glycoside hydrolase family 3 C-terminal domain-containing protein n=1 Tax=Asticcacaulis sp. AND118 TaxID=2840468 RepID=UPI001CFFDE2B|nr:glycoside hydrolase family 3 C-terminal domain-containing protein [Asticcacaulis sp. AND118]UDF05699.1 glycoside hydrolase family 3 C-terminal domain-containing protein [Asticcacaulis sp. AND118]
MFRLPKGRLFAAASAIALSFVMALPAAAQVASPEAEQRAKALVGQMTLDEKIRLVFGQYSTDMPSKHFVTPKGGRPSSAGYVDGVERLNIPPQWLTDAGVGVATHRTAKVKRERTALPSGIATAATWNRKRAYEGGAMIGREARLSGFNVLLAGGVNLLREPRNGRNFEYGGEDPWLAGVMVGEQIRGIQSNRIVSTLKHHAFNDQETNRNTLDVRIGEAAARASDLLALQVALEVGDPHSVMCAYNRVRGAYACESAWLLNEVLKKDWGFKGYVMSDWGAVHSTTQAANAGLDQQSGWPFDKAPYFDAPLKEAVQNGHVSPARLDDMVTRILWGLIASGAMDEAVSDRSAEIDYAAHAKITQTDAEEAIVLLKNNGVLPLAKTAKSILVVGGHADVAVLSGGGSSQVYGSPAMIVPNEGPEEFPGPMVWHPSSPVKALQVRTSAKITYLDGKDIAVAKKLAANSDVVIVFATQWTGESKDVESLSLPGQQDALIAALSGKKAVVVLQTGGPVLMPWLSKVGAVIEAWYPGTRGGEAIARVLTGEVNPSGRLPVTFPLSEAQLPRPVVDGDTKNKELRPTVDYDIEGAAVGYRWFDLKGHKPLFPFGFGLSYTRFAYDSLNAETSDGLKVSFRVTNSGQRAGQDVPQIYVAPVAGGWEAPKRLGNFDKLTLTPRETKTVNLSVDPRLLATYDEAKKQWIVRGGAYRVILARSATDPVREVTVTLPQQAYDLHGRKVP